MAAPFRSADRLATGRRAEARAAEVLEAAGYGIVARNYRGRRGELDLIARRGEELVVVEVRARLTESLGSPLESIGPAKRAAVRRTTRAFVAERGLADLSVRFDVITLSGPELDEVRWIENAFEIDDPWQ